MKKYIVSIFLLLALVPLYAFGNKENKKTSKEENTAYNYEITIDNMTCSLCDVAVEKQLSKLDWIEAVKGDHTTGLALIKVNNSPQEEEMSQIINRELADINYHFVKLRRIKND